MRKVCSITPEFKQLYKSKRQKLLEEHAKLLQAKRLQLERLQAKKLKEKELVQRIFKYGLWQSKHQSQEELLNKEGESYSFKYYNLIFVKRY